MKKLSDTQEKVINYAKQMIDKAKNEGIDAIFKYHGIANRKETNELCERMFTKEYEELLQNIVCTPSWISKHETLKKLESLGLIRIIKIEWNKFQLLNY